MWIDRNTCKCSCFLDLMDNSMQMPAGFIVYGNDMGTQCSKLLHISFWPFDHEVDIQGFGRLRWRASITGNPKLILGTNIPSMTST